MRLDTETQGKVKHSSTLVPSSHIIELNTIHAAAHVLEGWISSLMTSRSPTEQVHLEKDIDLWCGPHILTIIILLELLYESDDCTS